MRLLALLFALSLNAQNALRLDLSGEWRFTRDDRPEFARPDFDDRAWTTVAVPWGGNIRTRNIYWLRLRVEQPLVTNTATLALTLGTIQGAFQVFVNGHQVGEQDDRPADGQIARPRTFFFPTDTARVARPLVIAIRRLPGRPMDPRWRLPRSGTLSAHR